MHELEEEELEKEPDGLQAQSMQSLGSRLAGTFQEYKDARKETENEWLKDLRQYQGIYEPEVLARLDAASGSRSKVFVGLTRTKVMAAYSRIIDLLFQHGDVFFSVAPTPVPQIDPLKAMKMRQMAMDQIMMASGQDPMANQDLVAARMEELEEEFLEIEKEIAENAAESMTIDIEDQLIETNAEMKLKESMLEACIFGSGAVKAGTVRIDRKQSYSKMLDPQTGQQGFGISVVETVAPDVESVSIFDLYPDPYCTTLDDCDGLFRRHVLTRRQMRDLADLPQFDSEMVKYLLKIHRNGNHTEEDHETTRRRIAGINENSESNRFVVTRGHLPRRTGGVNLQEQHAHHRDVDQDG